MLDGKFIRENIELVKQKLEQRGSKIDLGELTTLDKKRREIVQ